jgi:hypothetical protein
MAYNPLVITGTTPNAPAGGTVIGSPAVFQVEAPEALDVNADLVGATGGVLNLYLQTSPDKGTTWYDYAAFAQLANGALATSVRFGLSRTSPSSGGLVVVGKGLVAAVGNALTAGTIIGGPFGDRMRLVAIAGAGTSAGAVITVRLTCSGAIGVSYPNA